MEPDSSDAKGPPPPPEPKPLNRTWVCLVLLGMALIGVNELFLSVFVVSGVSMEPTLSDGQRVLVLKRFYEVDRTDLLVFKNPTAPDEILIKRVLALPTEQIEVETLGVRVPADYYYLVGDNRSESVDSRRLGPIPRRLVVGKVLMTLGRP